MSKLELLPHSQTAANDEQQTIFLRVRALLHDKFDVATQSVHWDSELVGDLGIERTDLEYLALALEEAFEIDVSTDDAGLIVRVLDVVRCVQNSASSA